MSYLAVLKQTLGHWQGGSLTHPILITAYYLIQPECHREPCNEAGFQTCGAKQSQNKSRRGLNKQKAPYPLSFSLLYTIKNIPVPFEDHTS